MSDENIDMSPESRKNIKLMIALVIMLLIGIIVRWGFIKDELSDTVEHYKERMTLPSAEKDSVETK